MTLEQVLIELEKYLRWERLKHATKAEADMMELIAPVMVKQTTKLVRTRHVQAQSSAKRGTSNG
jgi:hypothetical protein